MLLHVSKCSLSHDRCSSWPFGNWSMTLLYSLLHEASRYSIEFLGGRPRCLEIDTELLGGRPRCFEIDDAELLGGRPRCFEIDAEWLGGRPRCQHAPHSADLVPFFVVWGVWLATLSLCVICMPAYSIAGVFCLPWLRFCVLGSLGLLF